MGGTLGLLFPEAMTDSDVIMWVLNLPGSTTDYLRTIW